MSAGRTATRPRVVVAGLGDSGLLTAIHLARHDDVEVVGVTTQPAMVSGQELGRRLADPTKWAADYWVPFDAYKRLDGVRVVQATLTGLDPAARTVSLEDADGTASAESYDALVISTGVTNGFWRRPGLRTQDDVEAELRAAHERLAKSGSIAVVGGGAAAVSSALHVALRWPDAAVGLYFPGERALTQHHPAVWGHVRDRLTRAGVSLHAGHRAVLPDNHDEITADPIAWTTGQAPVVVDAVLWTVGRVRPNTGWLPASVLDDDGFVRADEHLRVPGQPGLFTIGDVAATDPQRGSARNRADRMLAHNVRASLHGGSLKTYRAHRSRWGSVVGVQPDGLQVFTPKGQPFRFPAWTVDPVVQGLFVRRGIYGGVRRHARRSLD